MPKEFDERKVFDLIPNEFDKHRPRYCKEAFEDIISFTKLDKTKRLLEIGPGTGQASDPLIKTGCDYLGIELGKNLYDFCLKKYKDYPNAKFINDDFVKHDFKEEKYDVIFSAATIQWIDEEVAFKKSYELLKNGGCLIMISNISDEQIRNPQGLYKEKEEVYQKYFKPPFPYTRKINKMNVVNYGFSKPIISYFEYDVDLNTEDYIKRTMTHADHILLKEPNRSMFINGLREVINKYGGIWKSRDRVNVVKAIKL